MGMGIRSAGSGAQYQVNQIAQRQAAPAGVGRDGDNEATEGAAAKAQEAGAGGNVNLFA